MKKFLATLLAVVLVVGMLPMAAAAASGAQNVVEVAFKYYGQKATASTFGFSADWCGSFLYYIANEAGEGAAMGGSDYNMRYVPRSMDWFIANGAKVGYFYDALPNNTEAHLSRSQKMNKADYKPQLGDTVGSISFADSIDITYMADVRLLSGAGVIDGFYENGSTYFKPLDPITRAQVAAIVGRMVQPSTRVG